MAQNFKVAALFDYIKKEENELSLKEGEEYIVNDSKTDWWNVTNSAGERGWIPSNYVVIVGGDERIFCHFCGKNVKGRYRMIGDIKSHEECFVCSECKTPIQDKYGIVEGNYKCPDCMKKQGPRCGFCNEPIEGEYVNALDQNWHKDHFVCCGCGNPFETSYVNHENRPYCKDCFEENFLKKCSICGKLISKEYMIIGKLEIHPDCFKCAHDGAKLSPNDLFAVKDQKIFCQKHFIKVSTETCSSCDKEITGEFLVLKGQKFHKDCLKCVMCGKQLVEETITKVGDHYICNKHTKEPGLGKTDHFSKKDLSNIKEEDKCLKAVKKSPEKLKNINERKKENDENDKKVWEYKTLILPKEALPEHIDYRKRESYLSDADFEKMFKMNKETFYKLTLWKQKLLKKEVHLF